MNALRSVWQRLPVVLVRRTTIARACLTAYGQGYERGLVEGYAAGLVQAGKVARA